MTYHDDDDSEVYFSTWYLAGCHKGSIRQRLNYIWSIIKKGHPYEDHLILSYKEAQRLGKYLIAISKETV